MRFKEIKPTTISDTIAEQIESSILEGDIVAGEKLPAERELAKQFNVSRPSIREAINKLQAKGIVTKIPGGGTYITETVGMSFTDPLLELMASNPETMYDLLELRFAIEGLSAYFAAQRCSHEDKERIRKSYAELDAAHRDGDPRSEATADVNFHLAIAEASHNPVLVHIMRSLFSVLQKSVTISLKDLFIQPDQRQVIPAQHKEIMLTVVNNQPAEARQAMQTHIALVEARLAKIRQDQARNYSYIDKINDLKGLLNHEIDI